VTGFSGQSPQKMQFP